MSIEEKEVPEVVAVQYEDGTVLTAAECGSALEVCAKVQTPLMTVAQHERIVAAIKAEAHRNLMNMQDTRNAVMQENAELRAQLGAQPARHMGGDEPSAWKLSAKKGVNGAFGDDGRVVETREEVESFIAHYQGRGCDVMVTPLYSAALAPVSSQVGGDEPKPVGYVCGHALDCMQHGRMGAEEISMVAVPSGYRNTPLYTSAALAPAAVVMPKRKQWDASAGTAENMKSAAWNAALDEVARLNRRAIPLELLERVCSPRNEATGWAASADAISELRALLGKEP